MTKELKNCSTKANRELLAEQLKELAENCGATFYREEEIIPREITIFITLGPFKCMINLDGNSKVDGFMGHWHMDTKGRESKYPNPFLGGELNTYHFRKATAYASSFSAFKEILKDGLTQLAANLSELPKIENI